MVTESQLRGVMHIHQPKEFAQFTDGVHLVGSVFANRLTTLSLSLVIWMLVQDEHGQKVSLCFGPNQPLPTHLRPYYGEICSLPCLSSFYSDVFCLRC